MDSLPARGTHVEGILRLAGDRVLPLCGNATHLALKADNSIVTTSDLEAERIIIAGLNQHFPGEAIISEECGGKKGESLWWVVDPIDGTSAFSEGLAHWGPTVGRVLDGRVYCGGLYLPRLGESYYAEEGRAWLNGKLLPKISEERSAKVLYLPSRFHRYCSTSYRGKGRCLGGTAAHLAGVARGAAEGVIVAPGWALWDAAAGLALIEAVGGVAVRYPEGVPLDPVRDEGCTFLAGLPSLVDDFVRNQRVDVRTPGAANAGS